VPEAHVPRILFEIGPTAHPRAMTIAAVLLLAGCGTAGGTDYSRPMADPPSTGAKKNLHCIGLVTERRQGGVPGTVTDRYTAVFEGDTPDQPRTLSKVTYSARPRTVFDFANDGLTAIVTHDRTWKITSLEVSVSSNQLVIPTNVTKCPNKIIDRK